MNGAMRSGGCVPPDFWVWTLGVAVMLWVLGMSLSGCSRTVYVPVEKVRTDTVFRSAASVDTTYLRDSIHVEIRARADTVFVTKYKEHVRWRDRVMTDTVYATRTDSVAVPYPVERKLSRWEQARLDFGGAAIIAVLAVVVFFFGKLAYKARRR